jgi:hypothetical protein
LFLLFFELFKDAAGISLVAVYPRNILVVSVKDTYLNCVLVIHISSISCLCPYWIQICMDLKGGEGIIGRLEFSNELFIYIYVIFLLLSFSCFFVSSIV